MISFYGFDGRFIGTGSKEIDIKQGKNDVNISFDKEDYSTYKLLIWQGFDNMQALTKVQ